jgi:hypothetical protein
MIAMGETRFGRFGTVLDQAAVLPDSKPSAFGNEAPFCENPDSDGYTRVEGDCNESTRDVRPQEHETLDGVDEDCNGVVDDIDQYRGQ